MWVDVGGGYGQKTIALKRACPSLPGRFIVQDLPGTIQNAPKNEGIENMAHDFFTEQPVKGKRSDKHKSMNVESPVDTDKAYRCSSILHAPMLAQLAQSRMFEDSQRTSKGHEAGLLKALRPRIDRAGTRSFDLGGDAGLQHDDAVCNDGKNGGTMAPACGGCGAQSRWDSLSCG